MTLIESPADEHETAGKSADVPVASFTARSELMAQLSDMIKRRGWTQKEAAARLGVTQPRISDLMRGKLDLFSLDTLIDMAARAGLAPRILVSTGA